MEHIQDGVESDPAISFMNA